MNASRVSWTHPLIKNTLLLTSGIIPFRSNVFDASVHPFQSSLNPSNESNP